MMWPSHPLRDAVSASLPGKSDIHDPRHAEHPYRSFQTQPLLSTFREWKPNLAPPPPLNYSPVMDLTEGGMAAPSNGEAFGPRMTPRFYPETLGGLVVSTSV